MWSNVFFVTLHIIKIQSLNNPPESYVHMLNKGLLVSWTYHWDVESPLYVTETTVIISDVWFGFFPRCFSFKTQTLSDVWPWISQDDHEHVFLNHLEKSLATCQNHRIAARSMSVEPRPGSCQCLWYPGDATWELKVWIGTPHARHSMYGIFIPTFGWNLYGKM